MFLEMGMVVHACNPSTQEAQAWGYKFIVILGYIARPCARIFLMIIKVNTVTTLCYNATQLFISEVFFFTLKKSIKNAKIHTVICFTPSKLSSGNSSRKSTTPDSTINEIFMT